MKIKWFSKKKPEITVENKVRVEASGRWGHGYSVSFDGEKNAGEIGPIINYKLDYKGLRNRAYQSIIESEISKTVLNRYSMWIVDKGLKLQCAPAQNVLKSEGIEFDAEEFNNSVESRFSVFSKSKKVSHNEMMSLHEVAKETFKNAKTGGDMLIVLRVRNKSVSIQMVDGAHLVTPTLGLTTKGNRIIHGVEVDATGKHVAYHVKTLNSVERIEAWSKSTGLRMAFLVYGSKYRTDDVRGLPIIASSLETLKKIERYKEAAVGSAEERQKIVYTIEHNHHSSGESPMESQLTSMFDADGFDNNAIPVDEEGQKLASTVASTTNKSTYNMPIGSTMRALESKNEMFFKEFYSTNADIICGAIGIPPNVAFSIYNDSFSASRAATKDWEHTIDVERNDFQSQFYDPIFALWLYLEILKGKIYAPGFLKAFRSGDFIITESYLNAKFTGPLFPHIDPLKEVKAEREKLGSLAAHMPLTTVEKATEALFGGDSQSNTEQFAKEIKSAEELSLFEPVKSEPVKPAVNNEA